MKKNKFKTPEIKYDPIEQKTKPYWMLQVEQSKHTNEELSVRDALLAYFMFLGMMFFFGLIFYFGIIIWL